MTDCASHTRPLHRERSPLDEAKQAGFIALGCFSLFLGIVGAFLPIMPTTVFLIVAAWAFGRSSPRLERWMLDHPRFGRTLIAWRSSRAMSRRAKAAACTGIVAGYAIFLLTAKPSMLLAIVVFTVMACVAAWIVRRPEPTAQDLATAAGPITAQIDAALCDDSERVEIPCS